MAKYSGRCACGSVSYECDAEPARMINCHCRDCQRASGSAFAALLAFPKDRVKLSGARTYHAVTSERGTVLERGFCPRCGSPMTIKPSARPDALYVQAGKSRRSVAAQAGGEYLGQKRPAVGPRRSADSEFRDPPAAIGAAMASEL